VAGYSQAQAKRRLAMNMDWKVSLALGVLSASVQNLAFDLNGW
jgi:hypothetical protein